MQKIKWYVVIIIVTIILSATIIFSVLRNPPDDASNYTTITDTFVLEYIENTVCLPTLNPERTICCSAIAIGNDSRHLYLYVYKAAYFYENQNLSCNSVELFPVSLEVNCQGNQIDILGYSVPDEGSQYESSMHNIFPDSIIEKISCLTQEDFMRLEAFAEERALLMME